MKKKNRKNNTVRVLITILIVIIIFTVIGVLFLIEREKRSDKKEKNTVSNGISIIGEKIEGSEKEENKDTSKDKNGKKETSKKDKSKGSNQTTKKENQQVVAEEEFKELEKNPDVVVVKSINKGVTVPDTEREFALKELPYQVPDADLQITAIGNYSGPFVEDGKDQEVEDVLSIVLKNTSSEMIQYGELELQLLGGETASFTFSAVPGNASVFILESKAQTCLKNDKFLYKGCTGAYQTNVSLHEDEIQLNTDTGSIQVQNISDKKLNDIYVYYKYIDENDIYVGGITYRVSVGSLEAGESKEIEASHFVLDNSKILMVDYLEEK